MPPETPSTTAGPAGAMGSDDRVRDLLVGEQSAVDLAEGDRERLLLHAGLDQRADVLEQAFAELGVVGVDLASALGGVDDQAVLGVGRSEQLVDRGVGDADRVGDGAGHSAPQSADISIKATSRSAADSMSSLTTMWSNSSSAAISIRAMSRRSRIRSGSSVPRPPSRTARSSNDGGARKTRRASGMAARPCRAPLRSISKSTGTPAASCATTGSFGVPYDAPMCASCSSS